MVRIVGKDEEKSSAILANARNQPPRVFPCGPSQAVCQDNHDIAMASAEGSSGKRERPNVAYKETADVTEIHLCDPDTVCHFWTFELLVFLWS